MKLLTYLMLFIFLDKALLINAQPGSLNTNFGNDGVVTESGFGGIYASAIMPNGNIIVGGAGLLDSTAGFFIESYLPNGWLDSTFGKNGRTVADLGISDRIEKIIIQPDGKILAAGYSYRNVFTGGEYPEPNYNIALARFMPNGSLDSSFGKNGIIETDFGDIEQANSMVLQKDGKIVVGGSAAIFRTTGSPDDFLLVRYLSNGELDGSFGNNGQMRTNIYQNNNDKINGICLLPDEKIIAGGKTTRGSYDGTEGQLAIARYTSNGFLDVSFGNEGIIRTEFGPNDESIEDIAVQEDGKIVAAGFAILQKFSINKTMILIRYVSIGDIDESFGKLGKVNIKFDNATNSIGQTLAIQNNNKIIIGGVSFSQNRPGDFALARCLSNGNLDSSFGSNGMVQTDLGGDEIGNSCSLDKKGLIFLSGLSYTDSALLAIASYNGDPVNPRPTIAQIKRWIRNHILHFEDADTNAAYYVIEKSTANNGAFVPVTKITANAATNNYSYTLPETATQSAYRIKAVNKDNSITYSSPISSSDPAKAEVASFKVYPNPAKDRITVETIGTVQLRLQNSNGRVLLTQMVNGKGSIDISKLPNGIYYVVNTASGESLKLVKE